jgi:hypothetical protein
MSGADNKTTDRRKRNNMMLGLVLFGFVSLVFAITVSKMMSGQNMEAYDHSIRPALEQTQ